MMSGAAEEEEHERMDVEHKILSNQSSRKCRKNCFRARKIFSEEEDKNISLENVASWELSGRLVTFQIDLEKIFGGCNI